MRVLKNKTINNAFWLIGEKIFNLSISLISVSLVSRYLGAEGYGMLNYALAFVALFTVLSTLGLDNINIKSIVQKEASEGIILKTSLFLKGIGGLLILIITIAAVFSMGYSNDMQGYLMILVAGAYFFKSLEVIEYWVQAYQNSKFASLVRMAVTVISVSFKVVIVFKDLGIIYFGILTIIETILISLGLIYVYLKFREDHSKWQFSFAYAKSALSQGWYLILSGALVACYTQLDKVLLGNLSSKFDLGLYSAAMAVAYLWFFVPLAIINSFKPLIMKYKVEDEEKYMRKVQQLYSCLMLVNISCALGIFLLSDIIIKVIYGPSFEGASNLLMISVWAGCFAVMGSARAVWLLCEGLQKFSIIFIGIGAICSISLNLILIPNLGAAGAAVTILITEILSVFIAPMIFKKTRLFSNMFLKALLLKNLKG